MVETCYKAILVFVLLTPLYLATAQIRASYGEQCGTSTRCDSRAFLTCQNGICNCSMPDIMSFQNGKCSVLAGEKCTFTTIDSQAADEERSYREDLPCAENSDCEAGFCNCYPRFYETANGTCISKGGYMSKCELDLQCDSLQFFICNEEKKQCECNSNISTRPPNSAKCFKFAGVECETQNDNCIFNANCKTVSVNGMKNKWVCKCDDDYFVNNNNECELKRNYGETCDNDNQCRPDRSGNPLYCNSDGHCGCNETTSFFHEKNRICVRKAGVTCDDFPHCVDNSECKTTIFYHSVSPPKYSICQTDHFKTSLGTCEPKLLWNMRCPGKDSCLPPFVCGSSGVCECEKPHKIYDISSDTCLKLADTDCYSTKECIPTAECQNIRFERICKCKGGYSQSANKTCLVGHRNHCTTEDCDEQQGTICKSGKCVCKFEKHQEFNQKKCVSYVDGPCDENIPCVDNAHCEAKQCVCKDGFVSVDGICYLSIGRSCEYNGGRADLICDPVGGVKCIGGICQCDSLEYYDIKVLGCKGLVGSICSLDYAEYCTTNAVCTKLRNFSKDFKRGICECNTGWVSTTDGRCNRSSGLVQKVFAKNELSRVVNVTSTTDNPF